MTGVAGACHAWSIVQSKRPGLLRASLFAAGSWTSRLPRKSMAPAISAWWPILTSRQRLWPVQRQIMRLLPFASHFLHFGTIAVLLVYCEWLAGMLQCWGALRFRSGIADAFAVSGNADGLPCAGGWTDRRACLAAAVCCCLLLSLSSPMLRRSVACGLPLPSRSRAEQTGSATAGACRNSRESVAAPRDSQGRKAKPPDFAGGFFCLLWAIV